MCRPVCQHKLGGSSAGQGSPADQSFCRAKFLLGQVLSHRSRSLKVQQNILVRRIRLACTLNVDCLQGAELVNGTLNALEPIIQGINAAAQNPRYVVIRSHQATH